MLRNYRSLFRNHQPILGYRQQLIQSTTAITTTISYSMLILRAFYIKPKFNLKKLKQSLGLAPLNKTRLHFFHIRPLQYLKLSSFVITTFAESSLTQQTDRQTDNKVLAYQGVSKKHFYALHLLLINVLCHEKTKSTFR